MLGGAVDGQVGQGDEAGHTGDVDDGSSASASHFRQESVAEQSHRTHVDGQHLLGVSQSQSVSVSAAYEILSSYNPIIA